MTEPRKPRAEEVYAMKKDDTLILRNDLGEVGLKITARIPMLVRLSPGHLEIGGAGDQYWAWHEFAWGERAISAITRDLIFGAAVAALAEI